MRRAGAKKYAQPSRIDREGHEAVAEDFIKIELDLADTFCDLASQSHLPQRVRQHRSNARRAIDTATNVLMKLHIEKKERDSILQRIATLNERMEASEEARWQP
jgi:hypothetical protein